MRERLINNTRQPITLEDGTILAASGTDGSQRAVENLSERDRERYVETGKVAVAPPHSTDRMAAGGDAATPSTADVTSHRQPENQPSDSTMKVRNK